MTNLGEKSPAAEWFDRLDAAQKQNLVAHENNVNLLLNNAPYIFDLACKNTEWLIDTLTKKPDEVLGQVSADLTALGTASTSLDDLSIALRLAKSRVALLAAYSEVSGAWSPAQSTAALADLADVSLQTILDILIKEAAAKEQLTLPPEQVSATNSGIAIFALGKHGGRELNYSSDIDIVAFYDPNIGLLKEPEEAANFYAKVVRKLHTLMEERTEHGYVFRTDLRLRPDPGSTPVALSTDAAMAYYEVRGQNWERAAWIKARTAAGDAQVAQIFLKDITPFIWRKHLDFATIADIQAMKRQINVARKVGEARVAGHNVKLGRGGIREIEFFTQTQQLIAGGRDPALRVKPTVQALAALAKANWIGEQAATDLTKTYWYLRAVENRLQMIRDEQTHSMPDTDAEIAVIAELMGEGDLDTFKTIYRAHLATVINYYAELFTEGETLSSDFGDLVFTGSDDDPRTLDTLQGLGFVDAEKAVAMVRKWHYGGYPATRAAASRAHLTELLPTLLATIAGTGNADAALARFDHFLSRFPAGVQLFSLLRNHGELCRLLVAFMASAPRMAEAVIHRAHVMDGLIDPAFADGVSSTDILIEKIDVFLGQAQSFEDLIDRARIIGQEQKFLISAGFLSGTVDAARAAEQFTTLAETLLAKLFEAVQAEFAKRHGRVPGASVALLAFGKLASREMTAASDLDFFLLYDAPAGSDESDGDKPLAAPHYFARLTQRLVAALSAPTAEGVLYEADMRLRPSGNAGPLATSLPAFVAYQKDSAWTWERMALTRTRVVAGDSDLSGKIDAAIAKALSQPRDVQKTIDDVVDMRERLARERKSRHRFDLKLADGGLIDIEFIAQSAQLVAGDKIEAQHGTTATILLQLHEADLLAGADKLHQIHQTYATVLQVMSVCLPDPFKEEGWTLAFKDLLAQLANYPTFERLEADLDHMQATVREIAAAWYSNAKSVSERPGD